MPSICLSCQRLRSSQYSASVDWSPPPHLPSFAARPQEPRFDDEYREALKVSEEATTRVRCQSRAGRPAARLVWALAVDRRAHKIAAVFTSTEGDERAIETLRAAGGW